MEFISSRASLFQKLVIKHFLNTYNLKTIKNQSLLTSTNPNLIFINNNYVLLHNSILNHMYNIDLDVKKYSLVFILYKNINFRNKNGSFIVRLDSNLKLQVKNVFQKLKRCDINNEIVFIGRKYTNTIDKNDKITNCFGIFCTRNIETIKVTIDTSDTSDTSDTLDTLKIYDTSGEIQNNRSSIRRKFLMNVKSMLSNKTDNIYNLMKNGLFVDVEFTNDIYDDFKRFPISNDTSIMFMIGASWVEKENVYYNDFTVNRLCQTDEQYILTKFLDFIDNRYQTTNMCVLLFHWSNADKYAIEKSLRRYPDLYLRYTNMLSYIQYIDLLYVLKKTVVLPSYSLKYVSKYFLNISYESECQNGLDAMCSIIKNEIILQQSRQTRQCKTLFSFPSTTDIIHYNKIDTTLLYRVLKYFIY